MIKPVKTKKDYEAALQRCYDLMQKNIKSNSPEADELEILSILVENYEQKYFFVPTPNPVDVIT
jgi:HTH-type transcriptional regulator/antitoxin HigA